MMRSLIAGLAGQLRWAAGLSPPDIPVVSEILVVGMGGSGVSGDYLGHLVEGRAQVHKGYGLPGWTAAARPLVVAISYSGNTAETLSAVDEARRSGLQVVVVTSGGALSSMAAGEGWPRLEVPGGLQPRVALGYLLGATLVVAEAAGLYRGAAPALAEAGEVVEGLVGPAGWVLAEDLADGLTGRIPVIYATTGPTAAVAGRWKTQINENAKHPAWVSVIPELDHNEIEAWTGAPELSRRLGIVVLRSADELPEIRKRIEVTRAVTDRSVSWVGEVWAQGSSVLARMMSLTVVGDMTSVALAERAGVDPMPVTAIEDLKKRLQREED